MFLSSFRTFTRIVGCALLCAAMPALSGCGHLPARQPRTSSAIIVLVDRSVPGSAQREAQISLLDSLAKSAAEARCKFELWSYDSSASRLIGPVVLDSVDNLDYIENNKLAHVPQSAGRIARPDLALGATCRELSGSSLPGGRIVFLTDGYLMESGFGGLSSASAPLAKLPRWRVSVLGIEPSYRTEWDQALSPKLGRRLDLVDGPAAIKLLGENRDE